MTFVCNFTHSNYTGKFTTLRVAYTVTYVDVYEIMPKINNSLNFCVNFTAPVNLFVNF